MSPETKEKQAPDDTDDPPVRDASPEPDKAIFVLIFVHLVNLTGGRLRRHMQGGVAQDVDNLLGNVVLY